MGALRDNRTAVDLVPGASHRTLWSTAELREELAQASPPTLVDCQDLGGKGANAFGVAIAANCFYRTDGDKPRFWTFSFTADNHVAYFELEE